jgi:hypothetical protein
MRRTTMAGLVALPLLATAPLLPLTPASALATPDSSTASDTTISTLRLVGADGLVAVGTTDGVEQVHTDAVVADTVRHPAPGATGPLVIGDRCFSPANGPGLPYALLVDAADPTLCLTVRTVAAPDGSLRFVGDDAFSLVDGLTLEQAPGSNALRFGDTGSDFHIVTRGVFTAPELTTTTITVGGALTGTTQPGAHVVVVHGGDVVCEADATGEDGPQPGTWSCPTAALDVGEHDLELYGVSAANQPAGPRAVHVVVVADTGTDPGPSPEPDPGTDPEPVVGPAPGGESGAGTPTPTTAPTDAGSPTPSATTSATRPGRLAYTGAEIGAPAAVSGALLVLGALATALRRRQRRS